MRRAALVLLLSIPSLLAAQVLLECDFEDGTMGPFTALGPGWDVTDGALHCYTEGFAFFSSVLAGDPDWQDYIVAFDVRAEGSVNQIVRLRVTDLHDYYEVNVRTAPYNDVVFARQDYLGYEILHSEPFSNALGVWRHVEVAMVGHTVTVWVDGQVALVFTDPAAPAELATGSIALTCLAGGDVLWQDIWFDNVTVTAAGVVATEALSWSSVKRLFR